MKDIIMARIVRYFRSPVFCIALAVSLAGGLLMAPWWAENTGDILSYNGLVYDSPFDDFGQIISIWAQIILVALIAGQEFSDGAVRNKLTVGFTKGQVYFAELAASMAVTVCLYTVCMIPQLIAGRVFLGYMSAFQAARFIVITFLVSATMDVMALCLTFLIGRRAAAVVAVFACHFGLYCMVGLLMGYFENTEPRQWMGTYTVFDDDGNEREETSMIVNNYYIEGLPKILVYIEHYINPMSAIEDAVGYDIAVDASKLDDADLRAYCKQEREIQLDLVSLPLYCAAVTAAGVFLFRRKDLK